MLLGSRLATMRAVGRSKDYIYGTSADEIRRLALQHRLWADYTTAHWLRAGFREGMSILELGAGPGFATFDLAELVGAEGLVRAVEPEKRYAEVLSAELDRGAALHRAPIELSVGRGESVDLPEAAFDGAYARWVFTFVSNPLTLLRRVLGALRPGGTVAIFDYFDWPGMSWGPSQETLEDVRSAVLAMFEAHGTDGRVGQILPGALHEAGFELLESRSVMRMVRPSDALWRWPEVWMEAFLPTSVSAGYLSEKGLEAWQDEWSSNAAHPAGYFVTPPQIELVARRLLG